jgi:predicted AAA+ superfamily ATPase
MITRFNFKEIEDHVDKKEFTILIGARQIGKSTLLKQLFDKLQKQNKPVHFINLDRKDILNELDENPLNLFQLYPLQDGEKTIVLIDEIQYLKDASGFLKLLHDDYGDRLKIIATGSSAFYIDNHFKDSLVGRKKIFEMYTLNFDEFLAFKNRKELLEDLHKIRNSTKTKSIYKSEIFNLLDEYCNYGGYPAIVLENNIEDKMALLKDIRDSYIKRDVLESNIQDETKFYRFLMLLANQSGGLVNINELSKTLRVANVTIENYLFVLQKCFHIGLVKPFYNNLKKELIKMPKIYFNDLGLRNILINYFAPIQTRVDKGELFENLVYRQLLEKENNDHIKFWRTADGNEVDFVVENSYLKGYAIECKFSEEQINTKKYNKFVENYPQIPLQFLSWNDMGLFR